MSPFGSFLFFLAFRDLLRPRAAAAFFPLRTHCVSDWTTRRDFSPASRIRSLSSRVRHPLARSFLQCPPSPFCRGWMARVLWSVPSFFFSTRQGFLGPTPFLTVQCGGPLGARVFAVATALVSKAPCICTCRAFFFCAKHAPPLAFFEPRRGLFC